MTTISNTADHAADAISHARAAILDLPGQLMKLVDGARETERRGVDSILDRMGLQRRQSALAPVAWFAAGAVVAGAAAFILAPTSGKQLRRRIAAFLDAELEELSSDAAAAQHQVEAKGTSDVTAIKKMPNGTTHENSR